MAAVFGSTVHGALEMYVKQTILASNPAPESLELLIDLLKINFITIYGSSDYSSPEFAEAEEILSRWFDRTDFSQFRVLSAEVKESFPLKTSAGPLPFNYILDRFDQIGEHEYRVTDYKTNAWPINPDDLRKKLQARVYGLATQIKFPDATRIWVEFDMLKHQGPVGTVFTREDNIATWRRIKRTVEKILSTPIESPPETLNSECLFCVRKSSCNELRKNISAGGIFRLDRLEEALPLRLALDKQQRGISATLAELDRLILADARERDGFRFEGDDGTILEISASSRREVDPERVLKVIGPDLFGQYGGHSITMREFDRLLKAKDVLTPAQRRSLEGLVRMKPGAPKLNITTSSEEE